MILYAFDERKLQLGLNPVEADLSESPSLFDVNGCLTDYGIAMQNFTALKKIINLKKRAKQENRLFDAHISSLSQNGEIHFTPCFNAYLNKRLF
jgi:hypothetical protein